jgi:hypothetical protein
MLKILCEKTIFLKHNLEKDKIIHKSFFETNRSDKSNHQINVLVAD